jgi:hypothetical protein
VHGHASKYIVRRGLVSGRIEVPVIVLDEGVLAASFQ